MQVLILFGFLAATGGLVLLVAVLFWWVMRQAAHAQKYRQLKALIAEAESAMGIAPAVSGNTWEIRYQANGTTRSMSVHGSSAEEAWIDFVAKGGPSNGVLEVKRSITQAR